VLDEGVGEMLVHDLAQFCQSKKWLLLFCWISLKNIHWKNRKINFFNKNLNSIN
jgi:hypothetical protein